MKSKTEIKTELAGAVARKMEITRERLALKRVPFKVRTPQQHADMLRCWWRGSDAKEAARVLQLAYAFVRGLPYWWQERSTKADAEGIAVAIAAAADVTAEEVLAWLKAPVSTEDRAAFEAHLARAREAELERRRARARARAA